MKYSLGIAFFILGFIFTLMAVLDAFIGTVELGIVVSTLNFGFGFTFIGIGCILVELKHKG